MIEIIICLIVWFWGLTPTWLNIVVTILAFFRFSWRLLLTLCKIFELNKTIEDSTRKENTDGVQL